MRDTKLELEVIKHRLNLTGRRVDYYIEFTEKINSRICNKGIFIVDVIDARSIMFYDKLYKVDETRDIFKPRFALDTFDELIMDIEDFYEEIHKCVMRYLIENKLPYSYLHLDVDKTAEIVMKYINVIPVSKNDKTRIYKYDGKKLLIENKYLNKEYDLDSLSIESLKEVLLDYNIDWNNIIDGKFDTTVYDKFNI